MPMRRPVRRPVAMRVGIGERVWWRMVPLNAFECDGQSQARIRFEFDSHCKHSRLDRSWGRSHPTLSIHDHINLPPPHPRLLRTRHPHIGPGGPRRGGAETSHQTAVMENRGQGSCPAIPPVRDDPHQQGPSRHPASRRAEGIRCLIALLRGSSFGPGEPNGHRAPDDAQGWQDSR